MQPRVTDFLCSSRPSLPGLSHALTAVLSWLPHERPGGTLDSREAGDPYQWRERDDGQVRECSLGLSAMPVLWSAEGLTLAPDR